MDRAETVRLVSRDGRWYVEADGELVPVSGATPELPGTLLRTTLGWTYEALGDGRAVRLL